MSKSPILSYNVPLSFANVCEEYPDRTAIRFDANVVLTYAQLDRLANRAAHFMLSRGVRKGARVALCLEKTPSAYILPLAALKIGSPYFFLDPRNPAPRVSSIFEQCSPSILFHHENYSGPHAPQMVSCREVGTIPDFLVAISDESLPAVATTITGSDPAYVMFTSGSTGAPKGAVISHDNLIHFIEWIKDCLGFTPIDVHTNLNPLYFDNSVFDLYSTFFTGGQLVPFDNTTIQSPAALTARLRNSGCTVWFSVPSMLMFLQTMKAATRENLGVLKKVIFGGEGYPKAKLKDLFDQIGDLATILNVYGPTECTCICSCYELTSSDFENFEGLPPIGKLNQNFSYRLIHEGEEVTPGDTGELYLGGSCVGLGYFNQPELTASAFIQCPLNRTFRETVYRTGDLMRYDPQDGKLYFVGRRDSQVKHMGYRIELEEIQCAMISLDGVDEAVALHKHSSALSEIVGVVASSEALNERVLRRQLESLLPKYMIPSTIHIVARLPKNANGKTDRQRLFQMYCS